MGTKKLCEICKEQPATVPDRERMGRLINRVCRKCHAARLRGDVLAVVEAKRKRAEALRKQMDRFPVYLL